MSEQLAIVAIWTWGLALGALAFDYLRLRRELNAWKAWAAQQRTRRPQENAPLRPAVPGSTPAPARETPAPAGAMDAVLGRLNTPTAHPPKPARRMSWQQIARKRERADLDEVVKRRQDEVARHRAEVVERARLDNTRPPAAPVAVVEPIDDEETA